MSSKPLETNNNKSRKCFHFRIFSAAIRALSRLDLFGRSFLYSKHHSFVHHFHRPIFVTSLSDALWSQQNTKASRPENLFCLAAVNCDEFTAELNVLKGEIYWKRKSKAFIDNDN